MFSMLFLRHGSYISIKNHFQLILHLNGINLLAICAHKDEQNSQKKIIFLDGGMVKIFEFFFLKEKKVKVLTMTRQLCEM